MNDQEIKAKADKVKKDFAIFMLQFIEQYAPKLIEKYPDGTIGINHMNMSLGEEFADVLTYLNIGHDQGRSIIFDAKLLGYDFDDYWWKA